MDKKLSDKMCGCGCGLLTYIIDYSYPKKGYVKGQPAKFRKGHKFSKIPPPKIEDRGYKTPCHIFQGYKDRNGYGKMKRGNKSVIAHRFYFEKAHSPIPEGLELDHLCRVRSCINPDHVEVVDRKTNSRRSSWTKLTIEQAEEIRELRKTGEYTYKQIGKMYDVHLSTIFLVCARKIWT